jgi:hypothetical protein
MSARTELNEIFSCSYIAVATMLCHVLFQHQASFRSVNALFVCEQADVQKKGFPTIAELASERDWAPLLNLCRRRAFLAAELTDEHQGKTAFQWALHHGEIHIAEELAYFSVRP